MKYTVRNKYIYSTYSLYYIILKIASDFKKI